MNLSVRHSLQRIAWFDIEVAVHRTWSVVQVGTGTESPLVEAHSLGQPNPPGKYLKQASSLNVYEMFGGVAGMNGDMYGTLAAPWCRSKTSLQ